MTRQDALKLTVRSQLIQLAEQDGSIEVNDEETDEDDPKDEDY
jgi:hypothetical protein